jgi:pSer/pThr/pTyr-binding forkhead associated (FHA) protein
MPDSLTFEGNSRSPYSLKPGANTLGRSATNDLVLDESDASRYHALVIKNELGCTIEDLNTANGTYVNHSIVRQPRPLKNGDRIQIGKTVLRFYASQI